MDTNTIILLILGIIATAATTWWLRNKTNLLAKVSDELEERIEDLTGVDIDLDAVVDDVVSAAEEVVEDVHDAVVESLESGDTLGEVVEDAKDAGEESLEDVELDVEALKNLTVAALKVRLKELGLPVTGKKAELIERLLTSQS